MPDTIIGKGIGGFFNNFVGILPLRGVNLTPGNAIGSFFKA